MQIRSATPGEAEVGVRRGYEPAEDPVTSEQSFSAATKTASASSTTFRIQSVRSRRHLVLGELLELPALGLSSHEHVQTPGDCDQ